MSMRQERSRTLRGEGRKWKWGLQIAFLLSFLFLFAMTHYPWRAWVPYRLFFDLDPLVSLTSPAGTRHFILAAVFFVLAALLLGRAFCGYVCPLGFCIDVADLALARDGSGKGPGRNRHRDAGHPEEQPGEKCRVQGQSLPHDAGQPEDRRPEDPAGFGRTLPWIVLSTVAAGVLLHNSLTSVLDPISLFNRSLTIIFYPVAVGIANALLALFRPVAESLGWYRLAYFSFSQPGFYAVLGTLFLLLLVFLPSLIRRRFWCRHVCPLGGLLGLTARAALLQRRVAASCIDCGKCESVCPMGAIGQDPTLTRRSRCIQCRSCQGVCPVDAIAFPTGYAGKEGPQALPEGFSRRGFVLGVGAGSALLFLTRVDPRVKYRDGRWLRPPGAIPEEDFLAACVRCGACVRACVTHTLQASGMEHGLIHWGTPVPDLRFAGCEQQCNLCGQVCATGAIRSLPLVERQHAKMGTAVLDQQRCVAWERDRLCLLCDEACPYNAIVFKVVDGQRRPFVDESRCNGCGMCEAVCPIEGKAAIVVGPHGELRLKRGSYQKALNEQRIFLTPRRDMLDVSVEPGG